MARGPVILFLGDGMADEWEIEHFGGTNEVDVLNAAWTPVLGGTNVVSADGTLFYTNATPAKAGFYRVGVGLR